MIRQRRMKRSSSGFSLIELLLTIVLAGIVAATAFTPYGDALESIQVRIERERAYMIARQMVERYKALGFDGMSGIGVNPDGSQGEPEQVLSDLTIDNNGVPLKYKRRWSIRISAFQARL